MTNILEIINLSKKYNQNKNLNVLKNLNFKFKKGKIYSLIATSGMLHSINTGKRGSVILTMCLTSYDKFLKRLVAIYLTY